MFLCAVGGVMAFLTLHEMLPLAFDYCGQKQAVKAVFVGMACMSARFVMISMNVILVMWSFRTPAMQYENMNYSPVLNYRPFWLF